MGQEGEEEEEEVTETKLDSLSGRPENDHQGDKPNASSEKPTFATPATPATPAYTSLSGKESTNVQTNSTVKTQDPKQAEDRTSGNNKGSTEEDTAEESSYGVQKPKIGGDSVLDGNEGSEENKTEDTSNMNKETPPPEATTTPAAPQPKDDENDYAIKVSSEDNKKNTPPEVAMDTDCSVHITNDQNINDRKSDDGGSRIPANTKDAAKNVEHSAASDSIAGTGDEKPKTAPSHENISVPNTPDGM